MKTSLRLIVFFALVSAVRADDLRRYYGVVESFGGGAIVVHTTQHSTGHWTIDRGTAISERVLAGDWVFVEVETSGHVKWLRFEERPEHVVGVIVDVHGAVLRIHTGARYENWNRVETTITTGDVPLSDVQVGDQVSVKVYKNRNLAALRVLQRGVAVK